MLETVGVVIPTYMRSRETTRAIKSVLSQTHGSCQVIVVDDGSPIEIFQELEASIKDSRVRFIKIEHCGNPGKVRNVGLRELETQYVSFLDSDDFWENNKIETQLNQMKKTNCKAGCSNARIVGGTQEFPYFGKVSSKLKLSDLLKTNFIICSSTLIERDLLLKVGGFSTSHYVQSAEDYATWLRIAKFTNWSYSNELLTNYTVTGNRFSITYGSRNRYQTILAFIDFANWQELNLKKRKIGFEFLAKLMRYTL